MSVDLGVIGARIQLDDSQYVGAMRRVESGSANAMTRIAQAASVVLGTRGLVRQFREAAQAAMSFSAEIQNVASIAPGLDMDKVSKGILELDNRLGDATKNVNAFYYAWSAGIRGAEQDIVDFTGTMAKLAKAIKADQNTTIEAAARLMNAYGLKAKDAAEVSDLFFTIVKEGITTGQELAPTIGMIANSAALAGVDLDELGASIAVLTRTMDTSSAVVSLNQALTAFISPTAEAKRVAAELGIELSAATIKQKGFANAIADINAKAGDNIEALSAMFGNVRAFRAAAALAGEQTEVFSETLEAFRNKGGGALRAFEEQSKSMQAQWDEAMVAMGKAMIAVGQSIEPLVVGLSKALKVTADMISLAAEYRITWGGIALAIVGVTASAAMYVKTVFGIPLHIASMSASMAKLTTATVANTGATVANNIAMSNTQRIALMNAAAFYNMERGMNVASAAALRHASAQGALATSLSSLGLRNAVAGFQNLATGMTGVTVGVGAATAGVAALVVVTAAVAGGVGYLISRYTGLGEVLSNVIPDWMSGMNAANKQMEEANAKEEEWMEKRRARFEERLEQLRTEGKVTEEEYQKLKEAGAGGIVAGADGSRQTAWGRVSTIEEGYREEQAAKDKAWEERRAAEAENLQRLMAMGDYYNTQVEDAQKELNRRIFRENLSGVALYKAVLEQRELEHRKAIETIEQMDRVAEAARAAGNEEAAAEADKRQQEAIMRLQQLKADMARINKDIAAEAEKSNPFTQSIDAMSQGLADNLQEIRASVMSGTTSEREAWKERLDEYRTAYQGFARTLTELNAEIAGAEDENQRRMLMANRDRLMAQMDDAKRSIEELKAMSPEAQLNERFGGKSGVRKSLLESDKGTLDRENIPRLMATFSAEQQAKVKALTDQYMKRDGMSKEQAQTVAIRSLSKNLEVSGKDQDANQREMIRLLDDMLRTMKGGGEFNLGAL